MYDAIVVGARCAGSPTAMLLAQRGYRVLLVDKATFPSDKLSTHFILAAGVTQLEKWGLLEPVVATGCPPIDRFDVFMGDMPLPAGPPQDRASYCPRRYLLDKILVDAAVAAGVELREAFAVDAINIEGGKVTGITGHSRRGAKVTEQARYVIGADGHNSTVAKAVSAPKYRDDGSLTVGYYSYWSGLPMEGAEVHFSTRGGVLAFPTNNEQVCIATGAGRERFPEFKTKIEETFFHILDAAPKFAARVRAAKREERFQGTADLPNFFRKPFGDGWALVGDAGYMRDPVTGSGITDAFRDAELLATALDEAFSGRHPAAEALAGYQEQRDAAALPTYEATLQMASGALANQLASLVPAPAP